MRKRNRTKAIVAFMFFGLAVAGYAGLMPARAHHSASVYFDLSTEITVTGTVEEFVFKPPHAILRFIVINEDGEEELWRAETLPSNLLFRMGWRYNMFKVGEKVTVTGNPARDSKFHAMELLRVVTEDGRVISPFED